MIKRTTKFGTLAAVTVLLTGCFDIDQTFTVTNEASATFNFAFTMDTEMLDIADENDVDAQGNCDSDDLLENLPEDLTYVSDVRFEGESLICEYAVTGPLASFEDLVSDIDREIGGAELLSLEILDDHRARIVGSYSFSDDDVASASREAETSALGRSLKRMIAVNFEDHYITWTVRAPTVLESNGEIATDGRSVTWRLPLEQAIMDGEDYQFEAIIDYKKQRPRFF